MATVRGPIYLDTSALIKLYLPEPGSDSLERLVLDRRDLLVSDLAITEFASALGRLKRSGTISAELAGRHYQELLDDATSDGYYLRAIASVETYRRAERMLLSIDSVEIRTADALHLALASVNEARSIATFDRRLRQAAPTLGLSTLPE